MNRLAFRMMGDMNWQNHAGIATIPMKLATKMNIPLVFYGEHGWTDLGGMHWMYDFVEYTARFRKDQLLRGFDWYDMIDDEEDPIEEKELEAFKYPTDEEIQKLGLRGLFIGNFDPWDANAHMKLVTERYGWRENQLILRELTEGSQIWMICMRMEFTITSNMLSLDTGVGLITLVKTLGGGYMTRSEGGDGR